MTKKEKLLLAKKEKKVKLQKATECYKEGIEKYHKAKTRDEYEEAAESYTVAISLRPANPKYYFARANCFRAMGEYQRGFFDYSAAIQLDNECATYYGNRGICLRKVSSSSAVSTPLSPHAPIASLDKRTKQYKTTRQR